MRYLGLDIDFETPKGAPSLCAPESMSWRVFKNPVSLAVGGITAVILELAEPRVRHGVWDHSTFREKPLRRMRRTGNAAMATVYAPKDQAEAMIGRIGRMHGRVSGVTSCGKAYRADDPELMNWVQATASFGFLEAYAALVGGVTQADRDRLYGEAQAGARLYGATGAPRNEAECKALFEAMTPLLEPSDILLDFLDIVEEALPTPGAGLYVKAAIEILPDGIRRQLDLEDRRAKPWMMGVLRRLAKASDRIAPPGAPPVLACKRMGLPRDYLYRSKAVIGGGKFALPKS